MKKILSMVLLLGLLFTTNAQADENAHNADMLHVPLVELQDTQTGDNAVYLQDNDERLYLYESGDTGHAIGLEESGYSIALGSHIQTLENTFDTEIWSSYDSNTAEWRGDTSLLSLRRTGEGGTYLQGDHYQPEGDHYHFKGSTGAAKEKPTGLVGLGKVDSHRRFTVAHFAQPVRFVTQ